MSFQIVFLREMLLTKTALEILDAGSSLFVLTEMFRSATDFSAVFAGDYVKPNLRDIIPTAAAF